MDDLTLVRALHVLAVLVWIGGVALIILVLLPAVRRIAKPEERIALFESVERRFALEALMLSRWFAERANCDPDGTFRLVQRLHWVLLSVSLVTVAGGATAGARGAFF